MVVAMTVRNMYWLITDCFVPRVRPLSKAECLKQRKCEEVRLTTFDEQVAGIGNEEILREYVAECTKRLDQEEGRRQSVESRLTSIVGLCAIAATIVFGSILAQATGAMHVPRMWVRWVIGFGALYLAIQLCIAILSAVRGLERRSYLSHDPILPDNPERAATLRMRIIESNKRLANHQVQNNLKVTQMAVAHRALKNFIVALLLLGACGTYGALTAVSNDPIIDAIRKNREVQELLRGPQGPQGPKGEPCSVAQPPSKTTKTLLR
jgi:hypothetical protein